MAKNCIDKKLDKAWSNYVKERAGNKCEVCGKMEYLNAHHIVGRRNRATRWLIGNGIALCPACHTFSSTMSAHQTPTIFQEKLVELRGQEFIDELNQIARTPKKWTRAEKEELLQELKG